uniref:Transglutaminase N-terminal domain-containing protein n=1 Tax=Eptatretus burgeri TaxID=7764 RepID=A0A8C4QGE0_EPTBU
MPSLQTERLKVRSVQLYSRRDEFNRCAHHTAHYDSEELLVRRGQPFQVQLNFNRPYEPSKDAIILVLDIGKRPDTCKGTRIFIKLVESLEDVAWGACVVNASGYSLTLMVKTSSSCIVGRFSFYIFTHSPGGNYKSKKVPLYILFNPWCREDQVYMKGEAEKEEYVLNDHGLIFYGTSSDIISRSWIYGQFEKDVLDACLYILEHGKCALCERGNPIMVVRTIAAVVNANDDAGVLVGKWSDEDDYTGGLAPTMWDGSVNILRQFNRKCKPVCYAQCWVFSGTTTAGNDHAFHPETYSCV